MELLQLQGHRRRHRRYSRLSFLLPIYAPPVNFLLSHAVFSTSPKLENETRDSKDFQLRRHRLISIRRRLFSFVDFYPFLDSVLSLLSYTLIAKDITFV